jgi:hypothetical protein
MMARTLKVIAADIKSNWPNVNYAAVPYLEAMATLTNMRDNYYADSADNIVRYFLSNAGGWRGEHAKRIKAELRNML